MAQFLRHQACPKCNSHDALGVYDDGWAKCFSCDSNIHYDVVSMTTKKQDSEKERVIKTQDIIPLFDNFRPYSKRGLTQETIKRYGVGIGNEFEACYPLFDTNNEHVANKLRVSDKNFRIEGDFSACGLFGRQAFPPGSAKAITVTEGNDDAMAVHQMSGNRFPAVSVHSAATAVKNCQKDFEYLNSFETIVLAFDNDEAGQKAAKAVSSLGFPPGKIKVLVLRKHKDANDYLLAREADAFSKEWWQAPAYRPDGLKLGSDIWSEIIDRKESFSVPYPFDKLNDLTYGIRLSEMVIIAADTGVGKALSLDTPLPTPTGWTTMGDVQVGDKLLGADGHPCSVIFATDVQENRKCYKVVFDDGNTVIADEDHNWFTRRHIDRYTDNDGSVRTTKEIIESLHLAEGRSNHSVEITKPLDLPEDNHLAIPPYTLGAWLGDGSSSCGLIYSNDPEIVGFIERDGFVVDKLNQKYTYKIQGLRPLLIDIGVLQNKHIPEQYLRASFQQRMNLFKGLMDTDGYCAVANKTCQYTSVSKQLGEDVLELALSLGIKAVLKEGRAMLRGKDCGPKYSINFTTRFPVFNLPRKLARLPEYKGNGRTLNRYIVDIIEVDSVPVRCIQVDNEDHMFLCSRAMIPTHNTTFLKEIEHSLLTNPTVVEKGYGVGFLHLEEPNGDTALGLLSIHNSVPYHIPGVDRTEEELRKAYDEVLNNDRVVIWDHFGSNSVDAVIDKVRHMAALGCKYIIVDHLSIIVSDQSGDERKQLDEIATKLKTITMELDIAVIAVIHTNRKGEIRGTDGVGQLANMTIRLERDHLDENAFRRNVMKVIVAKNRKFGLTGPGTYLYYNNDTGRLLELDDEEIEKYKEGDAFGF